MFLIAKEQVNIMRVQRTHLGESDEPFFELIDERGQPIPVVSSFLRHLRTRGYSPNTLSAYAYDLLHFMTFLSEQHLSYQEFTPLGRSSFWSTCSLFPAGGKLIG
jgi:hypothetical protein